MIRHPHGPTSSRTADGTSDVPITAGFAIRNRPQRSPNLLLKRRTYGPNRHGKHMSFAYEKIVQFLYGLPQDIGPNSIVPIVEHPTEADSRHNRFIGNNDQRPHNRFDTTGKGHKSEMLQRIIDHLLPHGLRRIGTHRMILVGVNHHVEPFTDAIEDTGHLGRMLEVDIIVGGAVELDST